MVRAQSLYLWGSWFESRRADKAEKYELLHIFSHLSEPERCFASRRNREAGEARVSVGPQDRRPTGHGEEIIREDTPKNIPDD